MAVVVDSSGWIDFFADGPKANRFAAYLREPADVITPVIVIYEVYKKIKRERDEVLARECVAQMEKTAIIPLTASLAILAADLSLEYSLAMADSLVLATARMHAAELVTADADFRNIPGVHVF